MIGDKKMKINLFQKLLKELENFTYTLTPLARLRHKEVWLDYAKDVIDGESIRSSAKHCKVANSTTFRWRHPMLETPSTLKAEHMHGIVEFDETYFLESEKGNHHLGKNLVYEVERLLKEVY